MVIRKTANEKRKKNAHTPRQYFGKWQIIGFLLLCWQFPPRLSPWLTLVSRSHPKLYLARALSNTLFKYFDINVKSNICWVIKDVVIYPIYIINIFHPLATFLSSGYPLFLWRIMKLIDWMYSCASLKRASQISKKPNQNNITWMNKGWKILFSFISLHFTSHVKLRDWQKEKKRISSFITRTKVWLNMRENYSWAAFEYEGHIPLNTHCLEGTNMFVLFLLFIKNSGFNCLTIVY